MCPRPYRMSRRSESAEDTRQRIVRATYELHAQKGIAATSVRDIAERADVAVGTVYHHFPTYDEVLTACGEYTIELARPPGVEVLAGVRGPAARLRALVDAVFGFYQRFPGYERVRADRDKFVQLDRFLSADEANRRSLLVAALKPRKTGRHTLALALAMLDNGFYRALIAGGLRHQVAVEEVAALIERHLLDPSGPARPVATGAKEAT